MVRKYGWYYQRHKYRKIRNSCEMIKDHNISYPVPTMVLKNVTLQTVFRIVSAVTIPKTICGLEWDI